jgi:hypothetical protein
MRFFGICVVQASALGFLSIGCARAVNFEPADDRYARCAERAPARPVRAGAIAVTGTIVDIVDGTVVDSPAEMVIATRSGELVKAWLAPTFSHHPATPDFRHSHRELPDTQRGDCVSILGVRGSDGRIVVSRFDNLDRN